MIAADAAQAMAAEALAHWGPVALPPRLIKIRENIVFDVRLANGTRAALRLHRPGYQDRSSVEAELDWMAALAEAGLAVPRPVPRPDGALTALVGGRVCSCVEWLEGTPLGEAAVPLAGGVDAQAGVYHDLGHLLGRLHALTDTLPTATGAARPAWDRQGLTGEEPLWGRYWDNPAFDDRERNLIKSARSDAAQRLAAMEMAGADFGLIHADVLRENVLVGADGLALIDFDDSGRGFRLYDLGTALVQNLEEPAIGTLASALTSGYRLARPRAQVEPDDLAFFVLMRALASAGWIMSRAAPEDARQRLYAERAIRLARNFLDGTLPWGGA